MINCNLQICNGTVNVQRLKNSIKTLHFLLLLLEIEFSFSFYIAFCLSLFYLFDEK